MPDFNDPAPVEVDEATVRRFIEIVHDYAARAASGDGQAGVLQLCRIPSGR